MLINTTGQLDASTLLFAEQRSVAFVRPSDGGFQAMLARSLQSADSALRDDALRDDALRDDAPHHEPARTESPPATVDNGMREDRDDDRATRPDRAAAASSAEPPEGEHASTGSSEVSKVAADTAESERDARTGADSPGERTQKEGDREARLTARDGQISDGSARAAASKSSGAQKRLDQRRESAEDDRSDAHAKGVRAEPANPETDRAKHIELTLDLDRAISDNVDSDSTAAAPKQKHSATDAATLAGSVSPDARTRVRPGSGKGEKGDEGEKLPTDHLSAVKKPGRGAAAENRGIADRSVRAPRDKGTVDRSDRASERVQVEFRPSSSNALTEAEQAPGGRQSAQAGVDTLDTSQTGRADATGRGGSPITLRTTAQEASAGLARALTEHGNAEIVRSARLIVRGNDSGEIRLTLRPESMGNVRISLQMHEGHIAGRIIVENQSVREVFEQNLAALERAFQESGLETGALDVSVADSGDRSDGSGDGLGRASARRAAGLFSDAVPGAQWITEEHDLVNMVV